MVFLCCVLFMPELLSENEPRSILFSFGKCFDKSVGFFVVVVVLFGWLVLVG